MKKQIILLLLLMPFVWATAQTPNQVRLVIRADDIGFSHSANRACMQVYEEGIARTVEIMVPTPWYPEAVRLLSQAPGYDVGIHLTLTSEWENMKWRPLTHAPSLTDSNGYFFPMIWDNERFAPGQTLRGAPWKLAEVEAELRAQIETAKQHLPRLSHLTAHMGCSEMDPEVSALVKRLAAEYGLGQSPPMQRLPWKTSSPENTSKQARAFANMLKTLTPGTYLLVCHPGLDEAEMQAIGHSGYYHVAQERSAETRLLTHPQVKKAVKQLGIELVSYAQVMSEP
ncbi:MAG: ChbG/HpnK family deacetylase [Cytophagales bacterium]|nr:ChbG/HpnK family deacetylase [Cytophagales bacterium]